MFDVAHGLSRTCVERLLQQVLGQLRILFAVGWIGNRDAWSFLGAHHIWGS